MKAAALDRRVSFKRATLTDDGFGQAETWADHGSPVWASFQPISDAERLRGGEVAASLTARFRLRWSEFSSGLTPKDRLVFDGREHDIAGVKEVGRREWVEVTASARAD